MHLGFQLDFTSVLRIFFIFALDVGLALFLHELCQVIRTCCSIVPVVALRARFAYPAPFSILSKNFSNSSFFCYKPPMWSHIDALHDFELSRLEYSTKHKIGRKSSSVSNPWPSGNPSTFVLLHKIRTLNHHSTHTLPTPFRSFIF